MSRDRVKEGVKERGGRKKTGERKEKRKKGEKEGGRSVGLEGQIMEQLISW